MREIILDTETTGLDARGGDRLVEIGAVEMVNLFTTGRTFHRYINPDRPVPRQAYEIHGLSDAFLADKPRFDDIADDFLGFIGDGMLVIHNAGFDMGFINMELKKSGRPTIAETQVIDTLALARRKFPGSPSSLDALCSRFAIDNTHRTKHGALLDSELLAEVYIELKGGRQASLGLIDDDDRPHAISDHAPVRPRSKPLGSRLSDEERAAHRAFIESIGDKAIWNRYRTD